MTAPTCTYIQPADVADFLRIPIDDTTLPNITQVAKIIVRKEDEIDRMTGMTFGRTKQVVNDQHSLPLLYSYGWGTPIYLKHRKIKDLDPNQGDQIAIWTGSKYSPLDLSAGNFGAGYRLDTVFGELYFLGYLFTVLRDKRIRVTFRYGEDTVPNDIADACLKMTCIDLLTTSFHMDNIPMGTDGALEWDKIINLWREDIDRILRNREEIFVVTR